jgi:phage minor structural protein
MINIFRSDNTNYSNNGNATLVPIYCTQKVNINGVWQVVMEHPYDKEERWKFIVAGAVLKIHTTAVETASNDQLYRIYSVQTGLHSVYCEALPIALDAYNDTNVNSLTIDNKTGVQFASTLNDLWNKYTITSNITSENSGKYQNTNLIEILNGGDKCFSKLWKGEIKYDNTAISVNTRLDSNPATYKLRLGRDIKDIKYKVDETDVITRIYPVGASGARLNYQADYHIGDGKQYVDSAHINDYPIIHKAYIKTDYLICTTKADSKDGDAYFYTAQLLGSLSSDVVTWYSEALDEYMSGAFGYKGNVDFIKKAIKYTKKKDGVKGLAELLKDNITYLKNEELLKYINQTIDGSVGFIDNYDDSKYSLTKVGDRKTTITDGLQVNKGKDNECLNFEIDTTKISSVTQIVGLIYDNNGKIIERKEWSGTQSDPTFQIKVDLDGYDAIRIYYEKVFGVGTVTFPLIGEAVVSTLTTDYADWSDGIRIKKNEANSQVWFELDVTKIDEVTKIVGTKHNKSGAIVTTNIFTGHESSVEFHVDVDLTTYESLTIYYSVKLPSGTSTMPVITEVDVGNIPYDYYRYLLQNPQFESESEWVTDEWQRVDNRWRRFDENGYMLTVSDTGEWGWWNKSSHRYYGNAKKSIYVFDQWLKINGDWIWFDSNGDAHQRKSIISTLSAMFNGMFAMNLQTLLTDGEESLYKAFYLRLTTYAQDMYSKGADLPTITVDVDAMVLNNVVGYEGFATLKLGNGVHVDFGDLEADERVIGIEYDCVTNRNSKIILGAPSDTITSMINRKADVGSGYVGGYGIKIENNLITYSGGEGEGVGGGGSGSSDVSVLPKATEGTPVADIVVDDQTYHLYGGLQYWIEEKIEHSFQSELGTEYRYDYKIRHDVDWNSGHDAQELGWICDNNVAYEHLPDDRPISGSNWDAKVFEGAGSDDDSYDAFKAFGHCLIVCYETPYHDNPPHTSFHVMLIGQQLSDINDAITRHHNGYMHDDFDTGFLIHDFRVNAPDVDEGQYWYVAEQACIYSKTTEHHKTPYPYMGMFPADVDKQALAQYVVDDAHPIAPMEDQDGRIFTILENSNWENFLMYGGFNYKRPSEEDYKIENFPFRVSNNGTVTCKGLVLNGVSISNMLQDVTINGFPTVNRAYKTSEINLGSGLSYNRDTKTISTDFTGYTAGDNIDITNNVISATDTTYDVFGEEDGLVPAPSSGDTDKFLKADGTWAEVKINNARTIAWKNITPTQYEALSSAEKNNGVIYLVSENAQGASGFFTAWKSVTTAPSTADNILYLESENANGAMSMEITPTDKIPTENDNNLYFVGG